MKNILIPYFFFTAFAAQAQSPAIEWQKTLGGSDEDSPMVIRQTTDGGYIVIGHTTSNDGDITVNNGSEDIWIVKVSNMGNLQWQKSFGGSADDRGYSIRQTSDGGYIAVGFAFSDDGDAADSHGDGDAIVIKLSNTGSLQWKKCYGGSLIDGATDVVQTSDGYLVVGGTLSGDGDVIGNHGYVDAWVFKINNTGVLQWQTCLGGTGEDFAAGVGKTSTGDFVFSGVTNSNDGDVSVAYGEYDYWMVKINGSGGIIWEKTYGGSDDDEGFRFDMTTDGGYVMSGTSSSIDGHVTGLHGLLGDVWVVKVNSTGTIQWQKCLGGTDSEYSTSDISQTSDGGYIVCAGTSSYDGDVNNNHSGLSDSWLVKLTPSGNIQWELCLGGTAFDEGKNVIQSSDGHYVVVSEIMSGNGDVAENIGEADIWVTKIHPLLAGVEEEKFTAEIDVYPNPGNGQFHFNGMTGKNTVHIFDMTGRTVFEKSIDTPQFMVDLGLHENGVYTYTVTGETMASGKLVKQ